MEHKEKRRLFLGALLSLPLGYLWVECFWEQALAIMTIPVASWYPLLFTLCFFLWGTFILRGNEAKSREHWFWMGCTVLLGVAIGLEQCAAESPLGYLFLHGFAAYWVLCRAGLLILGESSAFLPLDLLDAGILKPFGGFFLRIITIFRGIAGWFQARLRPDSKWTWKNALITLSVILVAIPLFFHAANLLAGSDPAFSDLWAGISLFFTFQWDVPRWFPEFLADWILGLPVGAYLFGLLAKARLSQQPFANSQTVEASLRGFRFIPNALMVGVLGCFLGLYLLYFGVQANHLLGAFRGEVPGRLTASGYARDGFFQLVRVMAINFALMGGTAILCRSPLQGHRGLGIAGSALMGASLFLAVTAFSKLFLYIHRFGFTALRLLSLWAILVMSLGSILALVRLRRSFPAARLWIWFSAASFILICFIPA